MAYSGGEEGIIVHNYWILKVDVIDFLSILFVFLGIILFVSSQKLAHN